MRHIAVLLLLFAGSVNKPQARAEHPSFEKGSAQSSTQNSQQKQSESSFAPFPEDQPNTKPHEASAYDASTDALYRWYLRATIVGVAFALGGLWVLRNQNRNLANQIKIQSLALRQWVDTRNWSTSIPHRMRPRTLELVVDVVNPTTAPIVLLMIRITVSGGETNATGFPRNTLLLPSKPLTYRAYVTLTEEQAANFRSDDGLVLQVEGSITYIDSLRDEWEQRFHLMLACHRGPADGPAAEAMPSVYTHTLHEVKRLYDPDFPKPFWRRAIGWYVAQIEAMKNGDSEHD